MSDDHDPYHLETQLIHGKMMSPHWSYQDHIVPPISASTSYRLETSARGAEGFQEFAANSGTVINYRGAEEFDAFYRAQYESNGALIEAAGL